MPAKQTYEKYIIPIAVVVGGYFILKNFNLFGGSAADNNTSSINSGNAASINNSLAAAKASGDFATLTSAGAQSLATQIYNAGVASPVDADTIKRSLIQVNTLTDLLMVSQAFGTKQAGGAMCSLFGGFLSSVCGTYDLASWVAANLSQQDIAQVDGYLADQNINYVF